jgi:hypothetical protein
MVEGASYRDHTVKSMVAGEDPALEQSGDVAEVDVSSDPKDRVESSDLTRSESVSLDRKVLAVPQQEEDSNLCAICLDEYTDEDPAISTCCGCVGSNSWSGLPNSHALWRLFLTIKLHALASALIFAAGMLIICNASCNGLKEAGNARFVSTV